MFFFDKNFLDKLKNTFTPPFFGKNSLHDTNISIKANNDQEAIDNKNCSNTALIENNSLTDKSAKTEKPSVMIRLFSSYEELNSTPKSSKNTTPQPQVQAHNQRPTSVAETNVSATEEIKIDENFITELQNIFVEDKSVFNIHIKKKEEAEPEYRIYNSRAEKAEEQNVSVEEGPSTETFAPTISTERRRDKFKPSSSYYLNFDDQYKSNYSQSKNEDENAKGSSSASDLNTAIADIDNFIAQVEGKEQAQDIDLGPPLTEEELEQKLQGKEQAQDIDLGPPLTGEELEELLVSQPEPVFVELPKEETLSQKLDRLETYLVTNFAWNIGIPINKVKNFCNTIIANSNYTSLKNKLINIKSGTKYYYNYIFNVENQQVWDAKLNRYCREVLFNTDTYSVTTLLRIILFVPRTIGHTIRFFAQGIGFLSKKDVDAYMENKYQDHLIESRKNFFAFGYPDVDAEYVRRGPYWDPSRSTKYGIWHLQKLREALQHRRQLICDQVDAQLDLLESGGEEQSRATLQALSERMNRQPEQPVELPPGIRFLIEDIVENYINRPLREMRARELSGQPAVESSIVQTIPIPEQLKPLLGVQQDPLEQPKLVKELEGLGSKNVDLNSYASALLYLLPDDAINELAEQILRHSTIPPIVLSRILRGDITGRELVAYLTFDSDSLEKFHEVLHIRAIKTDEIITPRTLLDFIVASSEVFGINKNMLIYRIQDHVHQTNLDEPIIEESIIEQEKNTNPRTIFQDHPLIWAPLKGVFVKNQLISVGELISQVEKALSKETKTKLDRFIAKYDLDEHAKHVILYYYIRKKTDLWNKFNAENNRILEYQDAFLSEYRDFVRAHYAIRHIVGQYVSRFKITDAEIPLAVNKMFLPILEQYGEFFKNYRKYSSAADKKMRLLSKAYKGVRDRFSVFVKNSNVPIDDLDKEQIDLIRHRLVRVYGPPNTYVLNQINYVSGAVSPFSLPAVNKMLLPHIFLPAVCKAFREAEQLDKDTPLEYVRQIILNNLFGTSPYLKLTVADIFRFFYRNSWVMEQALNDPEREINPVSQHTVDYLTHVFQQVFNRILRGNKNMAILAERGRVLKPTNPKNKNTHFLEFMTEVFRGMPAELARIPLIPDNDKTAVLLFAAEFRQAFEALKKAHEKVMMEGMLRTPSLFGGPDQIRELLEKSIFKFNLNTVLSDALVENLFIDLGLFHLKPYDGFGPIGEEGPKTYLDCVFLTKQLSPLFHKNNEFLRKMVVGSEHYTRIRPDADPEKPIDRILSEEQFRLLLEIKTSHLLNSSEAFKGFKAKLINAIYSGVSDFKLRFIWALIQDFEPTDTVENAEDILRRILADDPFFKQADQDADYLLDDALQRPLQSTSSGALYSVLKTALKLSFTSHTQQVKAFKVYQRFTRLYFEERDAQCKRFLDLILASSTPDTIKIKFRSRLTKLRDALTESAKQHNASLENDFGQSIFDESYSRYSKILDDMIFDEVRFTDRLKTTAQNFADSFVESGFNSISKQIYNQLKFNEKYNIIVHTKHPFYEFSDPKDIIIDEPEVQSEKLKTLSKTYNHIFTNPHQNDLLLKTNIDNFKLKLEKYIASPIIDARNILILFYQYLVRPHIIDSINDIDITIKTIRAFFSDVKRGFLSTQRNAHDQRQQFQPTRPYFDNRLSPPSPLSTLFAAVADSDKFVRLTEFFQPAQFSEFSRYLESIKTYQKETRFGLLSVKSNVQFAKRFFAPIVEREMKPYNEIPVVPYRSIESYKILSFHGLRRIDGFRFRSRRLNEFTHFNLKLLDIEKLVPRINKNVNNNENEMQAFRSLSISPDFVIARNILRPIIKIRGAVKRYFFSEDNPPKFLEDFSDLSEHTKNIVSFFNKISGWVFPNLNKTSIDSTDARIYDILKYQNLDPQCKPVLIKFLGQSRVYNIFHELIKKTINLSIDDFYTSYYIKVEDKYPYLNSPLHHLAAQIKVSINDGLDYTLRFIGVKDNLTQLTIFSNKSYISFFHFIKASYNKESVWYYPHEVLKTMKHLIIKTPRPRTRFRGRFLLGQPQSRPEKEIGIIKEQFVVQNENRDHIFLIKEYTHHHPYLHDIYIIAGDKSPVQKFTQLSSYKEFMNPALRSLLQFDFGYIKVDYNDMFKGNFLTKKFISNINYKINIDKSFSNGAKVELLLNNKHRILDQNKNYIFSEFFKQSDYFLTSYGAYIKRAVRRYLSHAHKKKELFSHSNILKQTYLSKNNNMIYDKMHVQPIQTHYQRMKFADEHMKLSASWVKMYREREFAKNLNSNIYHQLWSYNIVGTIYAAPFKNFTPLGPTRFKSQYRYMLSSRNSWPSLKSFFRYPRFATEDLENRSAKIYEHFETTRETSKKHLDYFLFSRDYNLSRIGFDIWSELCVNYEHKFPTSILPKIAHYKKIKNNFIRELDCFYSNIQQCIAQILENPTHKLGITFHTLSLSENGRVPVLRFLKPMKEIIKWFAQKANHYSHDFHSYLEAFHACNHYTTFLYLSAIRITDKDWRAWQGVLYSITPVYRQFFKKPGIPIMQSNMRMPYIAFRKELKNRLIFKFDTVIIPNKTRIPYVHRRYSNILSHYLYSHTNNLKVKPMLMASPVEQFEFTKGNVLNLYKPTTFKHANLLQINQPGNFYFSFYKLKQIQAQLEGFIQYISYSIKGIRGSVSDLNIPKSKFFNIAKMLLFDSNYWNGGMIVWHIQNNKLYCQLLTPHFRGKRKSFRLRKLAKIPSTNNPEFTSHMGTLVRYDTEIYADCFFSFFPGKLKGRGQLLLSGFDRFDKFKELYDLKNTKRFHQLNLIRLSEQYTHSLKECKPIIVKALKKLKVYKKKNPQHFTKSRHKGRESYILPHPYVCALRSKTILQSINQDGLDWKLFLNFSRMLPSGLRQSKHVNSLVGDFIKKLNQTQPLNVPVTLQKGNKFLDVKKKELNLMKKNVLAEFYETISDLLKHDTFSWVTFHEYREELMRNQIISIPGGIITSLCSSLFQGSILTFILLAADYRRAPNKKGASRLFSWKMFMLFSLCSLGIYIEIDLTGFDIFAELLKMSKFSLGIQKVPQDIVVPVQVNYTIDDCDESAFKTPFYSHQEATWNSKLVAIIDYIFPKESNKVIEINPAKVMKPRRRKTIDFENFFNFE